MALKSVKQKTHSIFNKPDQDKMDFQFDAQGIQSNKMSIIQEDDDEVLDLGNLFALECNQN